MLPESGPDKSGVVGLSGDLYVALLPKIKTTPVMPSKNALARYYLINECLSNPRKPYCSLDEIIAKGKTRDIRASRRTFEVDIQAMRYDQGLNYLAPIVYC